MLVLGILAFVLAAMLVFFALRPKLSFYLDEGWKFRDRTEPSDAYIALNGVGRILGAFVAAAVGIWAIAQHFNQKRDDHDEREQADLYAAAQERCESQVLPRFNKAIKWDDGRVANSQELQALADELDVEIEITSGYAPGIGNKPSSRPDNMWVHDPTLPKHYDLLLYYNGIPSHLGPTAMPEECPIAPPP